jgi:hypothetical protein
VIWANPAPYLWSACSVLSLACWAPHGGGGARSYIAWLNFSKDAVPPTADFARPLGLELYDHTAVRPRVKVTGLAQKLGQLEAVNRDLQSKSWANLKILGQPCNFYAPALGVYKLVGSHKHASVSHSERARFLYGDFRWAWACSPLKDPSWRVSAPGQADTVDNVAESVNLAADPAHKVGLVFSSATEAARCAKDVSIAKPTSRRSRRTRGRSRRCTGS